MAVMSRLRPTHPDHPRPGHLPRPDPDFWNPGFDRCSDSSRGGFANNLAFRGRWGRLVYSCGGCGSSHARDPLGHGGGFRRKLRLYSQGQHNHSVGATAAGLESWVGLTMRPVGQVVVVRCGETSISGAKLPAWLSYRRVTKQWGK